MSLSLVADEPIALTGVRGSGIPGDEMEFAATIQRGNNFTSGQPYAAFRIIDNEELIDRTNFHFGVDPDTLEPTRTPLPIVNYQIFPVILRPRISDVFMDGERGFRATELGVQRIITVESEGNPTEWHWDFGLGFTPRFSNEQSPTVTATTPGGTLAGNVVVGNAVGLSEPFYFEYQVNSPTIRIAEQVTVSAVVESWDVAATSNAIVIAMQDTPGNRMYVAPLAPPGSETRLAAPENWTTYDLDPTSRFVAFDPIAIEPFNDGFIVAYEGDEPRGVEVAFSTATPPLSQDDWTEPHYIHTGDAFGYYPNITIVDGKPAILHRDGETMEPLYTRATEFMPTSIDDWVSHSLDPAVVVASTTSLTTIAGRPAAAFNNNNAAEIRYAYANIPEPNEAADWLQYNALEGQATHRVTIVNHGELPVIAWSDFLNRDLFGLLIPNIADPQAANRWEGDVIVDNTTREWPYGEVDMIESNGLLRVVGRTTNWPLINTAQTPFPRDFNFGGVNLNLDVGFTDWARIASIERDTSVLIYYNPDESQVRIYYADANS